MSINNLLILTDLFEIRNRKTSSVKSETTALKWWTPSEGKTFPSKAC